MPTTTMIARNRKPSPLSQAHSPLSTSFPYASLSLFHRHILFPPLRILLQLYAQLPITFASLPPHFSHISSLPSLAVQISPVEVSSVAMIAQIKGKLLGLESSFALLEMKDGLVYEILLPTFVVNRLGPMIGRDVKLFTLHYLESQGQGSTFIPRLAGFLTRQDKAFYETFTSVKGIGNRKGLRAMALASHQIAAAIADRDTATLQSLPEIGKRTAETIIVTLKDKVEPFIAPASESLPASSNPSDSTDLPSNQASPQPAELTPSSGSILKEALDVLTQLGENRIAAMQGLDRALQDDPRPTTVDELVAGYYRARQV